MGNDGMAEKHTWKQSTPLLKEVESEGGEIRLLVYINEDDPLWMQYANKSKEHAINVFKE